MGMPLSRVSVRVPASTSNLGPGFDCLGLALNLYNTTTLSREPEAKVSPGMIAATASAFFERALGGKLARFPFSVKIEGEIPVSRGLGSSVTVRLGILMGLAELVRDSFDLSREQILNLLIELEGHPDNAVPSFLGGFAICAPSGADPDAGFSYTRVPVKPELSFVALIPDLKLSTETARGLLPREVPFRHAVENGQRTARIAAAAVKAGALGSFLSGAGSSLMAVALNDTDAISAAMLETAKRHGLAAGVRVLKADNEGMTVSLG